MPPHPHEFAFSHSLVILARFSSTYTPSSVHDAMQILSTVILPLLALVGLVAAGPVVERRSSFTLKNGQDAQALNKKFASLSPSSKCTSGEVACVQGAFAQCVNGKFVTTPCSGGLTCVALPLVNSPGTRFVLLAPDNARLLLTLQSFSVTCDTESDAAARISRTGAKGGIKGRELES